MSDSALLGQPSEHSEPTREREEPRTKKKRRSALKRAALVIVALLALSALGLTLEMWSSLGTLPEGTRLARIQQSPEYRNGKFVDTIPRIDPNIFEATRRWVKGVEYGQPEAPPPIVARDAASFATPAATGLRITWFGHSTLLVEIEGRNVLVDPVWSERCSPSRLLGPRRFHAPPSELEALPKLDYVVISHDHYDHLDYRTIVRLKDSGARFLVPLGVGAHLEYWGIAAERIRELDWWERAEFEGISFVATPARHFSGRGLGADRTLWSGWAIIGRDRRVYYSGDTAMFEGFRQIGERLGPFDAAMIEVGAYDALWADVHLGPEQAVAAHRAVGAKVLFPVHWGTFNLALHSWVEPVERVLAAAEASGVRVVTPRPGQSIEPLAAPTPERWWPAVPWRKAAEAPVVSSGLERLR